jgi:hypothetical protein
MNSLRNELLLLQAQRHQCRLMTSLSRRTRMGRIRAKVGGQTRRRAVPQNQNEISPLSRSQTIILHLMMNIAQYSTTKMPDNSLCHHHRSSRTHRTHSQNIVSIRPIHSTQPAIQYRHYAQACRCKVNIWPPSLQYYRV